MEPIVNINPKIPAQATPPHFEWIEYHKQPEICYVSDFLKGHQNEPVSFYEALNLAAENQEAASRKYGDLNIVADDIYKRVVMHGKLDAPGRIARKTGAALRDEEIEKDYNYYDQEDSFIDDEADVGGKKCNQMQLVVARYEDFHAFEGDLSEFVKSAVYQQRLELLEQVARQSYPDPLKKSQTAATTSPVLPDPPKRPREDSLNKLVTPDKVKKKQKKSVPPADKEKPVGESKAAEHKQRNDREATIVAPQKRQPVMEMNRMYQGNYPPNSANFHPNPYQIPNMMQAMSGLSGFPGMPGMYLPMSYMPMPQSPTIPHMAPPMTPPQPPKKPPGEIIEIDE